MKADCHIHMVLDGVDWRAAMGRTQKDPTRPLFARPLPATKALATLTCGTEAISWAPEYGITYRIPLAPLSMVGHYGGFIGLQYDSLTEYQNLVFSQKAQGADFVKIMISGLLDFDRPGVLTETDFPCRSSTRWSILPTRRSWR